MRIAALGNYGVDFSTETHVTKSLESIGHEVTRIQEGDFTPIRIANEVCSGGYDLLWWTQTLGLADRGGPNADRLRMLEAIRTAGIPSVGFHLDRWFGLDREHQVSTEAFFRLDAVFTADGAHQREFEAAGVRHYPILPAVYAEEAEPGVFRPELAADVAFVGNWHSTYHREWMHRRELIHHLQRRWDVRLWPVEGQPAVRGQMLRDVYASTKVVVGDSCLVPTKRGEPMYAYCSDRIPETLGRQGFLIHPRVASVTDGPYESGEHLLTWTLGDWDELDVKIAYSRASDDYRQHIARQGRQHVLTHHTYAVRCQQVIETLEREGIVGVRT